jgi:hypothetical protein
VVRSILIRLRISARKGDEKPSGRWLCAAVCRSFTLLFPLYLVLLPYRLSSTIERCKIDDLRRANILLCQASQYFFQSNHFVIYEMRKRFKTRLKVVLNFVYLCVKYFITLLKNGCAILSGKGNFANPNKWQRCHASADGNISIIVTTKDIQSFLSTHLIFLFHFFSLVQIE